MAKQSYLIDRHVADAPRDDDAYIMVTIVPAILATTEEEYKEQLSKIEQSAEFEWVQLDLMDQKFVENKSVNAEVIGRYPSQLKREAHLMVEYPQSWVDELVKVGVERIAFPIEDNEGVKERIQHIKNHDLEVGLSINPDTEIETLIPFIGNLDAVLVMSVHPGKGGQEFIPESLEKIKECSRLRSNNNLSFKIGVDGGVSPENIKDIVEAGADYVVMGSHLVKGDIHAHLESIWEALQ